MSLLLWSSMAGVVPPWLCCCDPRWLVLCLPGCAVVILDGWCCASMVVLVWSSMAGVVPPWLCCFDPRWLVLCLHGCAVVILDGWWCASLVVLVVPPGGWWCILASSAAYCSRAPRQGHALTPQCGGARRRNPSFKGIKMKGYCSIYQLFKLSSWVALYKSFMDWNLIKTLFSINYRGYFIIQATHLTLNYSYFLHKTDRKRVETNKIV